MRRLATYGLGVGVLLLASSALATNGMNPIATSARSAGMGGVDHAIATEAHAMNTNPAGITQSDMRADATFQLLVPSLTLDDQVTTPQGVMKLNEGKESESALFPLFGIGFSARLVQNLYGAIGFYVQGGMGAEFQGLKTMVDDDPTAPLNGRPTPATYDTYSQLSYMKLTPTLAYKIPLNETTDVSLGVAFNVGFSKMKFNHSGFQFPEPDGDHVYAAQRVDYESDNAMGFGVRTGILARFFRGRFNVGVAYQSKADLSYGGNLTLNKQLKYSSEADFGWPQEIIGGIAGRPIEKLLVGVDVHWINWSSTMEKMTLKNTAKGQVPQGYEKVEMPFQLNWSDQLVLAVGAQYDAMQFLSVRAGFNHGSSPVGPDGVNPLFPAVTEDHITFGIGLRPAKGFTADLAFEAALNNKVTSDAKNQLAFEPPMPGQQPTPNGYQTSVAMAQKTFHLGVGYEF